MARTEKRIQVQTGMSAVRPKIVSRSAEVCGSFGMDVCVGQVFGSSETGGILLDRMENLECALEREGRDDRDECKRDPPSIRPSKHTSGTYHQDRRVKRRKSTEAW